MAHDELAALLLMTGQQKMEAAVGTQISRDALDIVNDAILVESPTLHITGRLEGRS
jgi:hypothetical protein